MCPGYVEIGVKFQTGAESRPPSFFPPTSVLSGPSVSHPLHPLRSRPVEVSLPVHGEERWDGGRVEGGDLERVGLDLVSPPSSIGVTLHECSRVTRLSSTDTPRTGDPSRDTGPTQGGRRRRPCVGSPRSDPCFPFCFLCRVLSEDEVPVRGLKQGPTHLEWWKQELYKTQEGVLTLGLQIPRLPILIYNSTPSSGTRTRSPWSSTPSTRRMVSTSGPAPSPSRVARPVTVFRTPI